jgi:xylose isomerase
MEAAAALGGRGFVFWGGREGYSTLLNTDTALEARNMATFLRAAAAHARKIGFKGALMLEPKPQEPTKVILFFFIPQQQQINQPTKRSLTTDHLPKIKS